MRKPSNRRKSYKKKTTKKLTVTKAVKKYVKNSISRSVEDKYHLTYSTNNSIVAPLYFLNLQPLINQGTGASQRAGNQVKIKSSYIDFIVSLASYNVTTNPYPAPTMFRWILVSQRTTNNNSFSSTNIFEINNSSLGPQGSHLDQLLRINHEHYKVHRQGAFQLGTTSNSSQFPQANTPVFDNSKFSTHKRLYFNKYMNKVLRYDDTATQVLNTNCWFIMFVTNCNGVNNTGAIPAYISQTVHYTYEDA